MTNYTQGKYHHSKNKLRKIVDNSEFNESVNEFITCEEPPFKVDLTSFQIEKHENEKIAEKKEFMKNIKN